MCTVRDETGASIREETLPVDCPAMASCQAGVILPKGEETLPIVRVLLKDEKNRLVSENEALDTLPKYFPFERPNITVQREGREITLTADTFCMGVELQAGDARFSDNWITLYPGESRVLTADRDPEEDLRLLWIE